MKIAGTLRSKTYLKRIFLYTTTAIFLLVIVFSFVIYYNTEKNMIESNYRSSREVLHQMNYNIGFVDEIVRNQCMSVFFNKDIVSVMYGDWSEEDIYEVISKVARLQTNVLIFNPIIHSIYIYNSRQEVYYTTFKELFFKDIILEEMLQSTHSLPRLKPVARRLVSEDSRGNPVEEKVLTYFMYENYANSRLGGMVVMNVRFDWFFDNLKQINQANSDGRDSIFILTREGEPVFKQSGEDTLDEELRQSLVRELGGNTGEGEDRMGFFTQKSGRINYLVTYMELHRSDLVLAKVQRLEEVFHNIQQLRMTLLLITGCFLAAALIASAALSMNIYKPIGRLVQLINPREWESEREDSRASDEILLLQQTYKKSIESIKSYKQEKDSNHEIVKTYYLRKILFDSHTLTKGEIAAMEREGYFTLDLSRDLQACLIQLDGYEDFKASNSARDRDLMRFAIENMLREVIAKEFVNETLDVKSDQILCVMNIPKQGTDYLENLISLLKEFQQHVANHLQLSVSISVGDRVVGLHNAAKSCSSAQDQMRYRYVLGLNAIITPEKVAKNQSQPPGYKLSLERRLADCIRSGSQEEIQEVLQNVKEEIRTCEYQTIMFLVVHLVIILKSILDDINLTRLEPVQLDFARLSGAIHSVETLDGFFEIINALLLPSLGVNKSAGQKQDFLIQAVRDIVKTNYWDGSLCLAQIANMLKMSVSHMGRVYRDGTGQSVSDYILEMRMEKAALWLETTDMSVQGIMAKVGIENESHFYKNFKRRFGVTPREYSLQRACREL